MTKEDIEEINKIPESEFQKIVQNKLQELQNSNEVAAAASNKVQLSDVLPIKDNKVGNAETVITLGYLGLLI